MPLDARDHAAVSCGENARWPSDPCGQPYGECSGRDRAFRLLCLDCRLSASGELSKDGFGAGTRPGAAFARLASLLASALG